jgi:hypothetical protein
VNECKPLADGADNEERQGVLVQVLKSVLRAPVHYEQTVRPRVHRYTMSKQSGHDAAGVLVQVLKSVLRAPGLNA